MGRKLVISGTALTDTTGPKIRNLDPIESEGSILLIDPTHPSRQWQPGVPVDGAALPNLFAGNIASIYGTGNPADYDAAMVRPAAFTGTAGLLERTTKGGLHAISPQAGTAIHQSGPVVAFSVAFIKWILARPENDFYVSVWANTTRIPSQSYAAAGFLSLNGDSQQTNSSLFHAAPAPVPENAWATRPIANAGPSMGQHQAPAGTPTGPKYLSMAATGWNTATAGLEKSIPGDGTNTAVTGSYAGGGIAFGSSANWRGVGSTGVEAVSDFNAGGSTAANKDKQPSMVFYRVYMENLTISRRTHAQIDALDYALYQKEVLTPGGRFYGDTFTNPSTLA
jgi:hypothetical protein